MFELVGYSVAVVIIMLYVIANYAVNSHGYYRLVREYEPRQSNSHIPKQNSELSMYNYVIILVVYDVHVHEIYMFTLSLLPPPDSSSDSVDWRARQHCAVQYRLLQNGLLHLHNRWKQRSTHKLVCPVAFDPLCYHIHA